MNTKENQQRMLRDYCKRLDRAVKLLNEVPFEEKVYAHENAYDIIYQLMNRLSGCVELVDTSKENWHEIVLTHAFSLYTND